MADPIPAARLGEHRASYGPEPQRWAATWVGGVALAVGAVPLSAVGAPWGAVIILSLTAVFAAVTADKVRVARRGVNARLDVFERGLAVTLSDGRVFAFPWDATTVLRGVTESHKNGTVVTYHQCTLAGPDRVAVMIGDPSSKSVAMRHLDVAECVPGARFENPEEWGRLVQHQVAEARLPQAARAIEDGQSLRFGPITLHRDWVKAGDGTLPWPHVRDFRVVNGRLHIEAEGRRRAVAQEPVAVIPNFPVLYALMNALTE